MYDDTVNQIKSLISKADKTDSPIEAMQLSQAAVNAANALAILLNYKDE